MDVSSKASVLAGTAQVLDEFGQLDILVNNAGYLVYTTFESCSEENWDRIVNVNMKGPFLCAQAVIPHMKTRPPRGHHQHDFPSGQDRRPSRWPSLRSGPKLASTP